MDLKHVDHIVDHHQEKRTAIISILHDIQGRYSYLPEGALRQVAKRLKMDLNEMYGVATFYKAFSLKPKGRHSITLCLGTACHVRGGPKILKEMTRMLSIEPGETTKDRKFSLDVVNCLGVCAIGPVMFVDGRFYGEMTPLKARRLVEKLGKGKGGVKS